MISIEKRENYGHGFRAKCDCGYGSTNAAEEQRSSCPELRLPARLVHSALLRAIPR
jgi:hypothetical protein